MTDQPDARIERARARLAANLGELQQRITRARNLVSPRTYLASPWLKVGLGLAAGYFLGRRHARKQLPSGDAPAPVPESGGLISAALRAAVMSAAGALIERAVARALAGPSEPAALDPASDASPPPGADPP